MPLDNRTVDRFPAVAACSASPGRLRELHPERYDL